MAVNRNPQTETTVRALLVAGMSGCVAISLAELGRMVVPGWNGAYVAVGAALAALEAAYSHHLVKARELHGSSLLRFRAVELVVMLVLVRIGAFVGDSWADILAQVSDWPRNPTRVISLEAAAAYFVVLLCWGAATQTAYDMERLDDPPHLHRGESPPTNAITSRFFWGGAVLLVASGLTRIGIASLLKLDFPPVPRLVINVLIYFLLGLALLGQAHFVRLRRQWRTQDMKVIGSLAGRWVRYSLILLALCALVALLLPTRYTVGLLDVIAQVIGAIAYVLGLIGLIFSFIISALINLFQSLLARLMGTRPATGPPLRFRLPPMQLQRLRPAVGGPDWLDVVRSVFFWAVALGVLIYLVRTYLRDHPELLETLGRLKIVRGLRTLLQAIWQRLAGLAQEAQERIAARVARRRAGQGPVSAAIGLLRPSARSPRDRVLYYYLSILERARLQGLPRKPAQTPDEYEATLAQRLPGTHEDMHALTRAFVEARYSEHTLDRDLSERVRASWRRLREALRARRRRSSK